MKMVMMKVQKEKIFAIISLLYITGAVVVSSFIANEAFYISMIPVLLVVYQCRHTDRLLRMVHSANLKEKICAVIVSLLFMVMLPAYDVYMTGISKKSLAMNLFLLVWTIVTFICSYIVLIQIVIKRENREHDIREDRGIHFEEFSVFFYIITFFSILSIVSCYPCLLHGDGWNIWNEVIGEADWNDWHPVGYTFFCVVSSLLWKNPFTVIIAQTLIWIYVNWIILFFLNKYKGNLSCKVYTVISFVSIMSYTYLHVMYKDVIFGICFLGFTVTLIAYLYGERKRFILISLVCFGILASLTRHMMIVPISVPMIILLCSRVMKHNWKEVKKIAVLFGSIIILYMGIKQSIMLITNAIPNEKYVKYSVAMEMMAAYAEKGQVDEESAEFMEAYISLDRWREAYEQDPYFADVISRAAYQYFNEEQLRDIEKHGKEIILVNWRFMTNYPRAYFKALFQQNMLCWRIAQSNERGNVIEPRFINCEPVVNEYNPEYNPQRNLITEVLEPISIFSKSCPIWKSFGYFAGIYVFMMMLCIVVMMNKRNLTDVIGMISTLVLGLMLAITIPMQDSRYVMPIMQVGVLYIALYSGNILYLYNGREGKYSTKRKNIKHMWWFVTAFILFVLLMYVKDQNRIYQTTVLEDTTITFEDKKAVKKSPFFPSQLYPDDDGVWFPSDYTMKVPYRIKSDMTLSFEGYCCDGEQEIEIYVNGKYVDGMKKEDPTANSTVYSCHIPQKFFHGKEQQIQIISKHDISLQLENEDGVEVEYKAAFYTEKMLLDLK